MTQVQLRTCGVGDVMDGGRDIVGRERELTALDRAIGPGNDGTRIVYLRGSAGMGKTTLAASAAQVAADRGFHTRWINGRGAAAGAPLSALIAGFPQLRDPRASHEIDGRDPHVYAGLLRSHLLETSQRAPQLLIVDDADALDSSTIAALSHVITSFDDEPDITFLLCARNDAGTPLRECLQRVRARNVVQEVLIRPLSVAAIDALLTGAGHDHDGEARERLLQSAAGNPWLALELARGVNGRIPVTARAAFRDSLMRLPDAMGRAISAVAVSDHGLHLRWLERLAGAPLDTDEMLSSGLVRIDGDICTSASPFVGETVAEDLGAVGRRLLHREIADAIAESGDPSPAAWRARAMHHAGAGSADDATAAFQTAASLASTAGQPHQAASDLLAAAAAEPRLTRRADLLVAAGYACIDAEHPDAARCWQELARIADVAQDDELLAHAWYQQYWSTFDGSARARLHQAAALHPERTGWAARACASIATLQARYADAIMHDEHALEIAVARGDQRLEMIASDKLGHCHSYVGNFGASEQHLRHAVQLALANGMHHAALSSWTNLVQVLIEALRTSEARAEAAAALRHAQQRGLARFEPWVAGFMALAEHASGTVSAAASTAEHAWRAQTQLGLHGAHVALVAVARAFVSVDAGDHVAAASAARTCSEIVDAHGATSLSFEATLAQARAAELTSSCDEALHLAASLSIDEPLGMAEMASWLARAGLWRGDERFSSLAREVLGSLAPTRIPLVEMLRRDCAAHLSASAGDGEPLAGVAEQWMVAGRSLDAGRAYAGHVLTRARRAGAGNDAVDDLREARRRLAALGALGDHDRLGQQLRGRGARTRAHHEISDVGPLSRRELQVARLVAAGLRNQDVSHQLGMPERTVRTHLTRIYRKLQIRSRTQLQTRLRELDTPQAV